jgi:hypothetical protein
MPFDADIEGAYDMVFHSAYHTTLQYGGPEEGGWWYNHNRLIYTIPAARGFEKYLHNWLREQFAEFDETSKRPYHSVLGGQRVSIIIETEPGENETTERPFYE